MALTFLQTLYAYFIEGEIVFVGKRKTFSKRVRHLLWRSLISNTNLGCWQIVTERITLSSSTEPVSKTKPPAYQLSLNYVRSTSGGKSLLAKGKTRGTKEYNAFFDEQGTMHQEVFERWVGELVEQAMEGKST
jgi:signal peptidase complex subunit 2